MNEKIECNGKPMTDPMNSVIKNAVRDMGLTSMDWLKDAVTQMATKNEYHPVKDYFNQLVWDGNDYIGILFSKYFTESTGFGEVALKRWMIGAVAKAMEESQNFMLVLDGPQGRGKSFFAKWLCPQIEWFTEGSINPESKDHKLRSLDTLIWEVAELQATTRKSDREALKSFLTLSRVKERRSYGQYDTDKPQLASFIGTINEDGAGFLRDSTGNRRFVIINIQEINQSYSTELDKNQLWAQAVALYKAGEPWQLTPEEAAKQREIQAEYEGQSVIASFMWDYYEIDRGSELYTLQTEVVQTMQNCGIKMNDGVLAEINRVVTAAGAKKIRPRVGNSRPVAYQCLLRLAKPTSIEPLKTAKEIANEIPI
jgi:predicted P-loop ATPase